MFRALIEDLGDFAKYRLISRRYMFIAQSCLTLCNSWTVAHQAPLSMGYSGQEYSSRLTFPTLGKMTTGVKKRTVHDERGSKQGGLA